MGNYAGALLSLLAAFAWGAGDYSGGIAARRAPVLLVGFISQLFGSLVMVVLALSTADAMPGARAVLFCVLSGIGNAVGIGFLYRALAIEKMGISAPVAAVITAVVPVIFTINMQGWPAPAQIAGFALALAAIWLIANPSGRAAISPGVKMAVASGIGFSVYLVLIKTGGASGIFWPVAISRGTSAVLLAVVAVVARTPVGAVRTLNSVRWILVLAGALDATGTAFFLAGTHRGRLDVAAVLASLYPASTVLLARLLLKERLSRLQAVGMAAALVAVALIAA